MSTSLERCSTGRHDFHWREARIPGGGTVLLKRRSGALAPRKNGHLLAARGHMLAHLVSLARSPAGSPAGSTITCSRRAGTCPCTPEHSPALPVILVAVGRAPARAPPITRPPGAGSSTCMWRTARRSRGQALVRPETGSLHPRAPALQARSPPRPTPEEATPTSEGATAAPEAATPLAARATLGAAGETARRERARGRAAGDLH